MRVLSSLICLASLATVVSCEKQAGETVGGEAIYSQHCASCHGVDGEGEEEEFDEPLWGDKSIQSLARYIHKSMPEDEEDSVVDEEAAAVAAYIHEAFYSTAAQIRNNPPRVELLRLTNIQYRRAMADLVASFMPRPTLGPERGLKGRYFNSEKMAKEKVAVGERIDPQIDFDFGTGAPMDKMTQRGFSIRWSGALLVPESGFYGIRLRTHNGALLHLNSWSGDREDSAFIDAYVSTGNALQEKTRSVFLLGGQAYPLALRYFSYQEKVSSLRLEWKPPHGAWEVIPREAFSPQSTGPVLVVQSKFSPDDRSLGYERGSDISKDWQEASTYAAIDVVNQLVTHSKTMVRLERKDLDEAGRLRSFCHRFAERAFRRPLHAEEKALFVDAHFEKESVPEVALKHSLLLVLTSPRFLYPELVANEGPPDGFTLAARLALNLWDSLPDEALRRAAAEGTLQTVEQITAQARKMLDDPRTRQKMRGFFRHWLAMDERESLGKDPVLYPGFDQQVVTDLRRSLEHFVEAVVWSEASDYRQLLRADYLYLNPRLAEFYHAPVASGPDFVRTILPDGPRVGIFTHPYLLSANAYHDNSSPIHRGVFLSRNVLGHLLKPPPEAVAFNNEEFDPSLTMREKVTELTKKESCMQCHRVINPIGFSLENFDAVGRMRTEDNKKPVNTVSDYVNDRDQKVQVASASDLADLAVQSKAAHRAFVTHLFHHFINQSPAAYGEDVLEGLCEQFVDSSYNIQSLLVEMMVMTSRHSTTLGQEPGPDLSVSTAHSNSTNSTDL